MAFDDPDPRVRYVVALRMLAGHCEALANMAEAGEYPLWPQGPIDHAQRALVDLLAQMAREEHGR